MPNLQTVFRLRLHLILIFTLAFCSFILSHRYFDTIDSYSNSLPALNLLFHHRLDVTNLDEALSQRHINIVNRAESGLLYTKTPPLLAFLSVPTFVILNKMYGVEYLTPDQIVLSDYSQYIGKLTASFYAALSAVLLFMLLNHLFSSNLSSLLGVFVYIFATNIFNTASQANWQHAISLVFILSHVLLIIRKNPTLVHIFLSGLVFGLAIQIRISNLLYILFPLIFLGKTQGKASKKTIALFLLGLSVSYFSLYFLYIRFGIPIAYQSDIQATFKEFVPLAYGYHAISLLFSFNYGLLVYSPVLCLALYQVKKNLFHSKYRPILVPLALVALAYLVFASIWPYWAGGTALNARMLTESLPIWIIFLTLVIKKQWHQPVFKIIFIGTFLVSFGINILTTFFMDWLWFPYYTKQGLEYQIENAWFHQPSLLSHILQRRVFHYEHMYKQGQSIMVHRVELRPDIKNHKIVTFEDIHYPILDLTAQHTVNPKIKN